MQFITALQPSYNVADFTNLTYPGPCKTVLNIDASLRLNPFNSVIVIIRNVARPVFNEIILRIVTRLRNAVSGGCQEVCLLGNWHVKIEGFEKPAANKTAAEITQKRVLRTLPLLNMK